MVTLKVMPILKQWSSLYIMWANGLWTKVMMIFIRTWNFILNTWRKRLKTSNHTWKKSKAWDHTWTSLKQLQIWFDIRNEKYIYIHNWLIQLTKLCHLIQWNPLPFIKENSALAVKFPFQCVPKKTPFQPGQREICSQFLHSFSKNLPLAVFCIDWTAKPRYDFVWIKVIINWEIFVWKVSLEFQKVVHAVPLLISTGFLKYPLELKFFFSSRLRTT